MTNTHSLSLVMSLLLAGCSSAPQDPPVTDAGGHPPDLAASNPPDMTVVAPPDLSPSVTLVATGDPGFGFRLADVSVGDSLFALVSRVTGIETGLKIVSISKSAGTVATLVDESAANGFELQVDPQHLVWLESTTGPYVLRAAPLSGASPVTLLDLSTASGVPTGSSIQDFYDSSADGKVYVVLGTTTAAELGSVPIGGGAYTKIASLTYTNQATVSGQSDCIRSVGGKLYVGGRVTVTGGTNAFSVVWEVVAGTATAISNTSSFLYVMVDDGSRAIWISDAAQISGRDAAASTTGALGAGLHSTFHAAAKNGVFYGVTQGGAAELITAYSVPLPSTFDNSGLPGVLATEAFITTDMAHTALIPTMSLDTDALYFSTDDGIYKAGL